MDPGRRYFVLRKIVDASGREYLLGYDTIAGSPRLTSLTDEFGRVVSFVYNSRAELTDVLGPPGQHAEHRRIYAYAGAPGRLSEVTAPEAAARGLGSYLELEYDADERVTRQRIGSRDGQVGGTVELRYAGDWVQTLVDRRGVERGFVFRDHLDSRVVVESSVEARQPAHALPGAPARYVSRYDYDGEYQLKHAVRPSGVVETREFAARGNPATVGDQRDWVERDWTVVDDLASGNLLREKLESPRPGEAPRVCTWEYEPLFNCVKEAATPTGTSRHTHDHGWSAAPENNGNASRVERPPRVQPDGTRLPVVEAFAYAAGGLLRESIDPDGIRSTFLHDSSGVLALAVLDADHLALTTVHTTDARGRVALTTDPDGAMTGFDYDDRDNLILTVDALNHEMHHDHDREDRVRDTWSTRRGRSSRICAPGSGPARRAASAARVRPAGAHRQRHPRSQQPRPAHRARIRSRGRPHTRALAARNRRFPDVAAKRRCGALVRARRTRTRRGRSVRHGRGGAARRAAPRSGRAPRLASRPGPGAYDLRAQWLR